MVIVGAALVAYANSFSVPFLLDDIKSILENPTIRHLWPLSAPLQPPAGAGVGGRPLVNLSFALNWAVGETDVAGYHALNLAIHLLAGLALFATVRLSLRRARRGEEADLLALVVAAVWLLHPLQTESITYVSQRAEAMMGLCYVLTVYCFLRGVEASPGKWWAVSVAASAVGMLCKEVMVTAPVVVLLVDRQFVAGTLRAALRQRRGYYAGLAATWLALALSLTAGLDQRGVGYVGVSWWDYALTECAAVLHYLRLALWPEPLVFDYGPIFVRHLAEAALPALVLLAAVVGTVIAWRRRAIAGFAGVIFFLLLAPTSSVVPVAAQPIAENRMYLPLAVLAIAAVVGSHVLLGRRVLVAWLAIAAGLGALAHLRNSDYRSALSIWTDTVAKRPENARAHSSLGAALVETGDLAGGIRAYERSLALDPNAGDTHNNLATALIDDGRPAAAVTHFRASLALRPNAASTHYNFGNLLLQLGQPAEAAAEHRRALALQPELGEAHAGLAAALAASGNSADAIAHYTEAVRLRPDLAAAHFGLANLLASANRVAEALPHYEATVRAVPDSPEAQVNLATTLAMLGRTADAIPHYEAALRLKPDFTEAKENLARVRTADAAKIKSP